MEAKAVKLTICCYNAKYLRGCINKMLEKLLIDAELSKKELAKRMGVTMVTVGRWKNGPPKYVITYLELLAGVKRTVKLWDSV